MDADQIIDRRRLKRKLVFWRVLALVVLILAIGGGLMASIGPESFSQRAKPHIARLSITGFISEDRAQTELIEKLADDKSVKGVLVSIDSSGGATVGGEALYDAVRKLADKKPTVASIKTVGASAAYMTAIATDHIVAYKSSITGSIGVLFQSPDVTEAMAKLGIKLVEVKSAPLKASPSPFEPASPEALAVINSLIQDSYNWFVDIVAERRHLDRPTALKLADGRVYSGRQALAAKLIDEVGGEEAAIAWLGTKGVDATLPVIDWAKEKPSSAFSFADAAIFWLSREVGLTPAALGATGIANWIPSRLQLDGLLSVWQASPGLNDAEGAPR
jgi:protease-4